ncbi:MAG: hypothetical protein HY282_13095 [Nitrospirae bacterium]|nr:hypothetical protein [Candidatus Manganitrophaceae bacterium]
MRISIKQIGAMVALLLWSHPVYAQDAAVAVTPGGAAVLFSGPHFFAALLVGIALAVAFQLALTHLSVAAGVTALGPVDRPETNDPKKSKKMEKDESGVMASARKITTGYGLWSLITASLALFFASWLAVEISLTASAALGAIIGLTIWGLFYLAMTYLQLGAVTSLVGGLIHTATSGLRSMRQAATSIFGSAPEEKAADTAAQVAASVRNELFGEMEPDDLRTEMKRFIQELKPKPIEPREIRNELEKLFSDTEIRAMTTHDDQLDRDQLVASFETKYGSREQRRETVEKAKGAAATVAEEARSEKPTAEKVVDAGLRLAGYSKEEAERTRQEWENYLRNTGKEALNPESIKHEIEILVHDPKRGASLLQSRASEAFNKSTVASLLAQREDMSREEAERTADRAEQIIREFRARGGGGVQQRLTAAQERAISRLRDYLNSLNRPELKYEGLRDDLLRLFRDPKGGADALIQRFSAIDRETLKALIASRRDTSPEDAEHILNQIESTRDNMVNKAEEMKAEVDRRMNELKKEGLRQAEETRKVIAAAAWWSFITAVVSGIAAIAGGLVGVA